MSEASASVDLACSAKTDDEVSSSFTPARPQDATVGPKRIKSEGNKASHDNLSSWASFWRCLVRLILSFSFMYSEIRLAAHRQKDKKYVYRAFTNGIARGELLDRQLKIRKVERKS